MGKPPYLKISFKEGTVAKGKRGVKTTFAQSLGVMELYQTCEEIFRLIGTAPVWWDNYGVLGLVSMSTLVCVYVTHRLKRLDQT